jgi:hypothetical protein
MEIWNFGRMGQQLPEKRRTMVSREPIARRAWNNRQFLTPWKYSVIYPRKLTANGPEAWINLAPGAGRYVTIPHAMGRLGVPEPMYKRCKNR